MTSDRLYRLLLHAYPAEFRDEYGAELLQLFRDRRRDAGTLATCLLTFADLFKTAPAEHLDILWRDLRSAVRYLLANPGFALVAVVSLALGLGANVAIFSLLHATLFNDLPVREPHQLVSIGRGGLGDSPPFSYLDYQDLSARAASFSGVFIHSDLYTVKLGRGAQIEETSCEFVSPNYFATLGLAPALGRAFVPEDARQPVIVISDGLWKRRFHGDPDVLGRAVRINGADLTVIGVAPESFHGVLIPWNTASWIPVQLLPRLVPDDAGALTDRLADCCGVIGRLKPGVSRAQAEAELSVMAGPLAEADARPRNSRREPGWDDLHLSSMRGVVPKLIRGRLSMLLGFLMAVTALVLMIACANVANLLLARVAARRGEIAIRLAVGARRGRLIRQLLTESALLTSIAAAATLFLAVYGPRAIASLSPYFIDARVNLPVLAFSAVAALVTTVAFGLAPAFEALRTDLVSTLKENCGTGGRARRFGLREALAAAQVAASFALLIAAGLFLRSLTGLQAIDPGFDTAHTFFVRLDLSDKLREPAQQDAFLDDLRRRVEHIDGVASQSFTSHVPLELGASRSAPFDIDGQTGSVWTDAVADRYFETLAIPLIAGRAIDARDRMNTAPVVVINSTLARRYWHGLNPVGREIRIGGGARTVIGVVASVKHRFAGEDPSAVAYIPLSQTPASDLRLIVKAAGDPARLIAPVLAQIQAIDPDIPVLRIRSMSSHVAESFGPQRGTAELAGLFGVLALALACMGIYGVIAHSVARRTHEIGIRMAMGARRRDVVRMIVGQCLTLAIVGVLAGSALALGLSRVLKGSLYGVSAADPATFVFIAALWLAVAALAAWIPARRAARVDPLIALRCE
jgi:putative ABC transport system permease protein